MRYHAFSGEDEVPLFPFHELAGDEFILLLGRRFTGKSTMEQRIALELARLKKVDLAIGFNPSETKKKPHLRRFIPPHLVYTRWDEPLVRSVMKHQQDTEAAQKVVIFLDDMLSERAESSTGRGEVAFARSPVLKELCLRGRHMGIMVVFAAQSLSELPTYMRKNTDIAFCMNEVDSTSLEALWKQYFRTVIREFDEFQDYAAACTANKGAIVMHCRHLTDNKPALFAARAIKKHDPMPNTFACGRPMYWRLDNHYLPPDTDDDPDGAGGFVDPSKLLGCSAEELAGLGLDPATMAATEASRSTGGADGGTAAVQQRQRRRRKPTAAARPSQQHVPRRVRVRVQEEDDPTDAEMEEEEDAFDDGT
jgi:hypothetical protein